MKPLDNRDCLELWERGSPLHPLDRGLLALAAVLPGTGESFADWPLGRRNASLVAIHCACFGAQLKAWSTCEACAERMEFELDGHALARRGAAVAAEEVSVEGATYRLPTTRDLAHALAEPDSDRGAELLVERCCLQTVHPAIDIEEVGRRLAAADPLAEILIELSCPACGHASQATLDIASFLWSEIDARARRLLREVDALARAYGWSEEAVLALSEPRRSAYLELVRA